MASKGTAESTAGTLSIVLLGKSGVGKSSCGNTILGREAFETRGSTSSNPVTLVSKMFSGHVQDKHLVVVDTPDLFGSQLTHGNLQKEIATIISLSSPGPCVYLLMLTLSELGDDLEGMLVFILEAFGERAMDFTMALLLLNEVDEEIVRSIIHQANHSLPMVLRNKFHVLCQDKHLSSILLNKMEAMLNQNSNEIPKAKPRGTFLTESTREERRNEREDQHKRDKPKGESNRKEEMGSGQREKRAFSAQLNKWRQQEKEQKVDCVRLVLIGKTGVGKSATGNTILGKSEFRSSSVMGSVTMNCKKKKKMIHGRMVQVIDTPGLFDTARSNEDIREEIGKCIAMSSPGPHVFLLLIAVGRFTKEEMDTVKMIQEIFGEYAKAYTMVGFTKAEELKEEGTDMKDYIKKSPAFLQKLVEDCGQRYHVFCNKDKDTREEQVISLLNNIDKMIRQNGGGFYTTAMFEETEANIRAKEMRMLQQKLEELVQAKEKKVSFIFNELTKIKQLWKIRSSQSVKSVREQDRDMIWFDDLLSNLENNQDKNISEIDGKILEELCNARDDIRKAAEKAEAKAVAKKVKVSERCTIS